MNVDVRDDCSRVHRVVLAPTSSVGGWRAACRVRDLVGADGSVFNGANQCGRLRWRAGSASGPVFLVTRERCDADRVCAPRD
jgi:hypothetical protein